jgi:methionyl-tRNA formyltransferase
LPQERAPPRIVFAGTPEFAVPSLVAVAQSGAQITRVLTQPDRPAGRGRRLAASPVKRAAEERGLTVAQPESLPRHADGADWLPPQAPDLMIVVAYGLLLPPWMLKWPLVACVNVHASLLPRWRGAAPIQHAILAGDAETGVCLMRMDEGLDTGPVYDRRGTPIGSREMAGQLHDRLARLGADLLADALPGILDRSLEATPQDDSTSTHAPKINKADGRLDWREPAQALARRVRAFNPWPVAFATMSDGRRLRILDATALPATAGASPGDIVAAGRGGIDVMTADGVLRLERVQPPSSRVMDAEAYLAAHAVDRVRFV